MTEYVRDKILPEDMIQRTNLQQHNFMIDAINDIDGRQGDIERVTNVNIDDIVDLKTDVIALSNEKLDKDDIDADLHFGNITVTRDGTAVIMSLDVLNPTTNAVTPISFTIPGATTAEAGTMDASSVAWIADAEERISALEGLSDVKAVADLPGAPTQAQLTTGWVAVAGKSPETGDILQDINNSKLWVFVGTDWVLYGTIVTVPLATTSTIGGVRDTSLTALGNRWFCHVEADGRLALIGGDSLSTLVDTTVPGIQSGVNNSVKKTGDETISGIKTFTNTPVVMGNYANIQFKSNLTNSNLLFYNNNSESRNTLIRSQDDKTTYALSQIQTTNNRNGISAEIVVRVNDADNEGYVTASRRSNPGSYDVVTDGYLNTRLTAKQDKLTFDSTPITGSTNPVTSGGVYTALAGKLSAFNLYEHTIRVTGTQSGGEIIKFSLTVLNQSPTMFTLQTLCDYLGSAPDDFKQCSGISRTMGTQMNLRYITGVRGHNETELLLETVNPDTGSIDLLGLPWTGGYTVTLSDRVRQIV